MRHANSGKYMFRRCIVFTLLFTLLFANLNTASAHQGTQDARDPDCLSEISDEEAFNLFSIKGATPQQVKSIHNAIREATFPWELLVEPLNRQHGKIQVIFQKGNFNPYALGKKMVLPSKTVNPQFYFLVELAHIVDHLVLTQEDRFRIIEMTGGTNWLEPSAPYSERVGEWFMYHFLREWGGPKYHSTTVFGKAIPEHLREEFRNLVVPPTMFSDVSFNSIHYRGIKNLTGRGMLKGYGDCTFRPGKAMTRGEVAVVIVRVLGISPGGPDAFRDDNGKWYEQHVNAIAKAGIIDGCAVNKFCPEDNITRAEAAKIISIAFNIPKGSIDWFRDDNGTWYEDYADGLREKKIVAGCKYRVFCGGAYLTRAQMASLLMRTIYRYKFN